MKKQAVKRKVAARPNWRAIVNPLVDAREAEMEAIDRVKYAIEIEVIKETRRRGVRITTEVRNYIGDTLWNIGDSSIPREVLEA